MSGGEPDQGAGAASTDTWPMATRPEIAGCFRPNTAMVEFTKSRRKVVELRHVLRGLTIIPSDVSTKEWMTELLLLLRRSVRVTAPGCRYSVCTAVTLMVHAPAMSLA